MPSFLEREQLVPVAPVMADANQILGELQTRQGLYGMGAAQVKSTQGQYNNLQLTNGQNQTQLDALNKQANEQLKTASLADMSVGQNREAALSVFDPIKNDQNIMGDHALTSHWAQQRGAAEGDRVTNGGKAYNQSAVQAINLQQQLFANSDKSTWKQFYANKEQYNSYYDKTGEMEKLQKMFKSDVIEKDTQKGAYIITDKNSSWYKDKWQQFVEANASPQLKAQLGTEARAEYYRDMLTMDRVQMIDKYTNIRNSLISKQQSVDKGALLDTYASLSIKTNSKDNHSLRTELLARKDYLEQAYLDKEKQKSQPLEGRDAIGDVNSLSAGTRVAEQLGQYKYFDRIGDAFAHKDIKETIKPDYAYLGLTKIREDARQFNLHQSESNRHNRVTEGETGRHNQAEEQIGLMNAINRGLGKAGKSGVGGGNDPTNRTGNLLDTNDEGAKSDPTSIQTKGQTVLGHLNDITTQYEAVGDVALGNLFSKQTMDALDSMLKDPKSANMTLRDLPDPSRAADGSGGIVNRMAQFIAATGQITQSGPGYLAGIDNPAAAYGMKLKDVRDALRTAILNKDIFKTGVEAMKKNDPSLDSYGVASKLEIDRQRIDGQHAQVVNNVLPQLRQNLGKYSKYFEEDFFDKGRIPSADDVKNVISKIPEAELGNLAFKDVTVGDKFSHVFGTSRNDINRQHIADNVTKNIYSVLGNNRTATNTKFEDYMPDKGNPVKDVDYQRNILYLIDGAETATKGNGSSKMSAVLDFAKQHPELIQGVRMNSVGLSSDQPTMQIRFKTTKETTAKGVAGAFDLKIPTTNANKKFYDTITDDRTDLLNNGSLKFSAQYADGSSSNMSIYNSTGSADNPILDLNKDFSYKTLDVDPVTRQVRGLRTVYRRDVINNWANGKGESQFMIDINTDPTTMHNDLSKTIIMNRDAVNEYLKDPTKVKTIDDLPDYIKQYLPR